MQHRLAGEVVLADVMGLPECLVDVTESRLHVHADVARLVVVQLGGTFAERLLRVGDGRQHFVVHPDQGEGLERGVLVDGGHRGDLLADVADLPPSQGVLVPGIGPQAVAVVAEVGAHYDGAHPRHSEGRGAVDPQDLGVGVRAVQDLPNQHPRKGKVVGEAGLPGGLDRPVDSGQSPAQHGVLCHLLCPLVGLVRRTLGSALIGAAPGGSRFDGLDNLRVARAPAQIAGNGSADLLPAGMGMLVEECLGRQDHAGSAEPALDGPALDEGLLQRIEGVTVAQALDRADLLALHSHSEGQAPEHGPAIDEHRARPAVAGVTGPLGARVAKIVSKHFEQRPLGFHCDLVKHPIDAQLHQTLQALPPPDSTGKSAAAPLAAPSGLIPISRARRCFLHALEYSTGWLLGVF